MIWRYLCDLLILGIRLGEQYMTEKNEVEIRTLNQLEDLEAVRRLESEIWGSGDSIPTHQTLTVVKNGGLVLGAFYDGKLVGFQYSLPGFNGNSVYLCSHVLGTDKQFRNKGIGEMLKLAQKEEALKLGYSLITWTYDPLESVNGYLNIGKLGGKTSTYIPNCYGEMEDLLNSGLPSDRLLVEWNIKEGLEQKGLDFEIEEVLANSLIQWNMDREGLPVPIMEFTMPDKRSEALFVAIPKDFRTIRVTKPEVAIEWRLKTREVFTELFEHGWHVSGFKKSPISDIPVHFYILTKVGAAANEN